MKDTKQIGRLLSFVAGVICLFLLAYKILFLDYIARHQNLAKHQSGASEIPRNFFDVAIDQGNVVELSLYLAIGIGFLVLAFILRKD